MKYSDKLVSHFKKYFKEKYDKEFTDEEANESLGNMAGLFKVFSEIVQEDVRNKNRLKKEPGGFPVEGQYSCLVCGRSINETNGWYDWYGHTCLLCRKAVLDGIIPTFIFKHRDSFYHSWSLSNKFGIKYPTIRKMIREEKIKARIILKADCKPYDYIFLKKENPQLVDPDRNSPMRKSWDKWNRKKIDRRKNKA